MNRLTEKINGEVLLNSSFSELDALKKLSQYEDMQETLLEEQEKVIKKLSDLKAEGKEKTATYRQLLGEKLMLMTLVDRFKIWLE